MKEAIGNLTQGLVESGLGTALSEKELDELGVKVSASEVAAVEETKSNKREFGQFRGEFERADDFDSAQVNNQITELFEQTGKTNDH
ncbi:MAG: hypothetical protein MJK04_37590 [Psychrosphaera sp.]|nr:hypothetical protein [Psychrosphaera sp.]